METGKKKHRPYAVLLLQLAISFLLMYGVMFLNMDSIDHYHTSFTRIYMALLMITPMAVLMVLFMGNMYPFKKTNMAIVLSALIVFVASLFILRTQTPTADVQYMKAMIPHHSSAILTSKHAAISDPEVRRLADSIIASQEREIRQMEKILQRMK